MSDECMEKEVCATTPDAASATEECKEQEMCNSQTAKEESAEETPNKLFKFLTNMKIEEQDDRRQKAKDMFLLFAKDVYKPDKDNNDELANKIITFLEENGPDKKKQSQEEFNILLQGFFSGALSKLVLTSSNSTDAETIKADLLAKSKICWIPLATDGSKNAELLQEFMRFIGELDLTQSNVATVLVNNQLTCMTWLQKVEETTVQFSLLKRDLDVLKQLFNSVPNASVVRKLSKEERFINELGNEGSSLFQTVVLLHELESETNDYHGVVRQFPPFEAKAPKLFDTTLKKMFSVPLFNIIALNSKIADERKRFLDDCIQPLFTNTDPEVQLQALRTFVDYIENGQLDKEMWLAWGLNDLTSLVTTVMQMLKVISTEIKDLKPEAITLLKRMSYTGKYDANNNVLALFAGMPQVVGAIYQGGGENEGMFPFNAVNAFYNDKKDKKTQETPTAAPAATVAKSLNMLIKKQPAQDPAKPLSPEVKTTLGQKVFTMLKDNKKLEKIQQLFPITTAIQPANGTPNGTAANGGGNDRAFVINPIDKKNEVDKMTTLDIYFMTKKVIDKVKTHLQEALDKVVPKNEDKSVTSERQNTSERVKSYYDELSEKLDAQALAYENYLVGEYEPRTQSTIATTSTQQQAPNVTEPDGLAAALQQARVPFDQTLQGADMRTNQPVFLMQSAIQQTTGQDIQPDAGERTPGIPTTTVSSHLQAKEAVTQYVRELDIGLKHKMKRSVITKFMTDSENFKLILSRKFQDHTVKYANLVAAAGVKFEQIKTIDVKDAIEKAKAKKVEYQNDGSRTETGSSRYCRVIDDLIASYKKALTQYYSLHFGYVTNKMGPQYKYIKKWIEIIQMRKKHHELYLPVYEGAKATANQEQAATKQLGGAAGYTEYDNVLQDYENKVKKRLAKLQDIARGFLSADNRDVQLNDDGTGAAIKYTEFNNVYVGMRNLLVNRIGELHKDHKDTYKKKLEAVEDYALKVRSKISSLYDIDYNIMDIIMDSRFMAVYVLKIVHYMILIGSLYLTEKIFSEMYMKQVYAENHDPPNILIMLGILIAIDAGFLLFLITVLLLLKYIFSSPSNDFIITNELITTFIKDYVVYMVLVGSLAAIIGQIIQNKKYFKYKTEGLRGIRAFKEIFLSLAGVLLVVPYFIAFD